jgi:hypothetical protein
VLVALAVLGAPALTVAPVLAQQDARPEDCCLLLLVPVGARGSALGGATTGSAGPDAVFRNPAGLAGLGSSTFVVHHSDRSVVDINAFSLLLAPAAGTVGLSYQLFDWGTVVTTDPSGQPTGELSFRDHLVVASAGTGIGRGMAVGANYKMFQERVDCRGACGGAERVTTTHAVDVGYRYSPRWQPALELGLALVNIPIWSTGDRGSGGFPARVHVGASYDVLSPLGREDRVALRVAVDVQDDLRSPGALAPSAGLELDMQQVVFLRAGYTLGEGLAAGAAIGVALRYDRFDVGVSRSFINTSFEDDEPFQVTFGINF